MKKYTKIMIVIYAIIAILFVVGFKTRSVKREMRTDVDVISENRVFDDADLFTLDEEKILQERIKKIVEVEKTDVAIVTTNNTKGKTAQEYAENFYTEHGFGYDRAKGTGVMLLIDMDTSITGKRKIWISGCGDTKNQITNDVATKISNNIKDQCADGKYYEASLKFLNQAKSYMNASGVIPPFLRNTLVLLLIAMVGTAIVIFIKVKTFGMKVTAGVSNYVDRSSLRINSEKDIFLGTTVTTRTIERDDRNSGSGGGGGSDFSGGGADF